MRGKERVMECSCIVMEGCMKVSGEMIREMEEDLSCLRLDQSSWGTMSIINHMVREYLLGQMVRYTMVSGCKELKTGLGSGRELWKTPILESGRIVRLKAMVFIVGRMVIDMRVNGSTVLNMAKVQITLPMGTLIMDSMTKESRMGLVPINGRMELHILVILCMGSKTDLETGRKIKAKTQTAMKATLKVT